MHILYDILTKTTLFDIGEKMLYNIKKSIKQIDDRRKNKEYRDLAYELESFIIDYSSNDNGSFTDDKEGKLLLAQKVLDESEHMKVFSRIRPVLIRLGINEGLKGFRLLEACVVEALRIYQNCGVFSMKDVFPSVADKFGISSVNCERLCRYACKDIIPTRDFAMEYPFFEALTHRTYEPVTVKELVETLVNYVHLECNFTSRYTR